jgi:hypothetical protein
LIGMAHSDGSAPPCFRHSPGEPKRGQVPSGDAKRPPVRNFGSLCERVARPCVDLCATVEGIAPSDLLSSACRGVIAAVSPPRTEQLQHATKPHWHAKRNSINEHESRSGRVHLECHTGRKLRQLADSCGLVGGEIEGSSCRPSRKFRF